MKKDLLGKLLLGTLFVMAGAQAADNDVAATMGGIQVKAAEIRSVLDLRGDGVASKVSDNLPLLEQVIRTEALRKAILADGRKSGWGNNANIALAAERARDQVLVDTYVAEKAKVSDDYPAAKDIEQFYNANKNLLITPRKLHLAQVFLPAGQDAAADEKQKEKIEQIRKKLADKGADFLEIARQTKGEQPSSYLSGDMGWVAQNGLLPELREEIAALSKGEVSKVLRTPTGWHIIKLIDSKPEAVASLDEAKDAIVQVLRKNKFEENKKSYLAGLLEKTPISVTDAKALKDMFSPRR